MAPGRIREKSSISMCAANRYSWFSVSASQLAMTRECAIFLTSAKSWLMCELSFSTASIE
jgi:hypothetical protein